MKKYEINTGRHNIKITRNLHLTTQNLTVTSDIGTPIKSYIVSINKEGVDYKLISFYKLKYAKALALELEDKFILSKGLSELRQNLVFEEFMRNIPKDGSN